MRLYLENCCYNRPYDKFDYTKWKSTHYDDMTVKEISDAASKYVSEHPFKGKAKRI